jgi:hypothetical protein
METLPKQTSLFTEETLTSSRGDSHANPTQWQESERAKKMRDISGRKCLEQLERFNRVGSWAKMFSALLIGMEGWYSTRCRLTWRLKGTKYNRMFFQLVPSMLPIAGTGSGLLLTPSTVDIGITDGRVENLRKGATVSESGFHSMSLTHFAVSGLLPTPSTQEIAHNEAELTENGRRKASNGNSHSMNLTDHAIRGLLPTPRACESIERRNMKTIVDKVENGGDVTLTTLAKYKSGIMLPTPATRDWKGARSTEALEKSGRNETNNLPDAFAQTGKTSQLSPLFVTEMMGYPIDYLVSPFQSGETKA